MQRSPCEDRTGDASTWSGPRSYHLAELAFATAECPQAAFGTRAARFEGTMPILLVFAVVILAVVVVTLLFVLGSGSDRTARHVLIACPETLDLVPTGMEAGGLPDLDDDNQLVGCASCGGNHEWGPRDAVLADSPL